MKSIMLLAHSDAGQESRLQCALAVVRAVGGRLDCLGITRPPILADGLGLGYGQSAIVVDDPEDAQALEVQLTARLHKEDVPFSWIQSGGTIEIAIADNAGLSDLVIVSREGIEGSFEAVDLPALVAVKTRSSLLVVPPGQTGLDLSGPAMIAWDGSETAASAARAAAPLLALASRVDIVSIDRGGDVDTTAVLRYLAACGCDNVVTHALAPTGDAGAQLIGAMDDLKVQWAAAGCYGHSRLRQQIFGGVTRTLMKQAPVPLLIAH
jgi:nucleotide-binding universal stress UspA family protein